MSANIPQRIFKNLPFNYFQLVDQYIIKKYIFSELTVTVGSDIIHEMKERNNGDNIYNHRTRHLILTPRSFRCHKKKSTYLINITIPF